MIRINGGGSCGALGALVYAGTFTRDSRRCGGVEVGRWLYFDGSNFHYHLLGAGIRAVLALNTKAQQQINKAYV
jgi:hypothetical protein